MGLILWARGLTLFYVLRTVDVPFAATPKETFVVDSFEKPEQTTAAFARASASFPLDHIEIVETVLAQDHAKSPGKKGTATIPPELERAVSAWNRVAVTTTPRLPRVKVVANYLSPYRRWQKKARGRMFLLEDLVNLVPRLNPEWFQWLNFGWLFGEKNGTLNSEKVMHVTSKRTATTAARTPAEKKAE